MASFFILIMLYQFTHVLILLHPACSIAARSMQ